MKAAIVIRISRETQHEQSQREELLAKARRDGFEVPEEYIFQEQISGDESDKGLTFDIEDDRESIRNLKRAIERNGDIEAIYIWELTRLSRTPLRLLYQVEYFNERHIPLYIYDADLWTLDKVTKQVNQETERYIYGAATYGRVELEKIRRRTMRGRAAKARKGCFVGHVSDGYLVVLRDDGEKYVDEDKERKRIIKRIFELYTQEDYSTDRIAALLNEEGVPTFYSYQFQKKKGKPNIKETFTTNSGVERSKTRILWTGASVCNILKNEWYIGKRTFKVDCERDLDGNPIDKDGNIIDITKKSERKKEVPVNITITVPRFIDDETFEKAQKKLRHNKLETTKRRECIYPLKGLLFCGKCGSQMYGRKVRLFQSYYCSSVETGKKCGQDGISKFNIDSIVWNLIVDAYCTHNFVAEHNERLRERIYNFLGINEEDKHKVENAIKVLERREIELSEQLSQQRRVFAGLAKDMRLDSNKPFLTELKDEQNKCRKRADSLAKELNQVQSELQSERQRLIILTESSQKSVQETIRKRVEDIQQHHNIREIQQIFHRLLRKVTLYDSVDYNKVIEIEAINGRLFYIIYNARRHRRKYIECPQMLDWHFDSPTESFLFDGTIYAYGKDGKYVFTRQAISTMSKKILAEHNEEYTSFTIENSIHITELYHYLVDNDKFYIHPIVHIEQEPSDEEHTKWKEEQRMWYMLRESRRAEQRKLGKDIRTEELAKYRQGKVTIDELVPQVNVSKSQIWRDIKSGKLPAELYNATYYIKQEDADEYIRSRKK